MRISDWSSDVCSSDLNQRAQLLGDLDDTGGKAGAAFITDVAFDGDQIFAGHRQVFKADVAQILRSRQLHAIRAINPNAERAAAVRQKVKIPILACGRRKTIQAGLGGARSEEHTSEPQSLMRNSYAGFCLKKKIKNTT